MATKDDKEPKRVVAAKRVFDVSKPGDTAADATSRPIIVGHKTLMQDPMVSPAEDAKPSESSPAAEVAKPTAAIRGSKVIVPLSEQKPVDQQAAGTSEASQPAEAAPQKPAATTESSSGKSETTPATDTPQSDDAAVVDAVLEQSKKKPNEPSEAELEKQAEVAKLIESKKYFLPIGAGAHARNTATAVILLVGVIGLLGAVLAIDAGFLNIGVKLPFHIITKP